MSKSWSHREEPTLHQPVDPLLWRLLAMYVILALLGAVAVGVWS